MSVEDISVESPQAYVESGYFCGSSPECFFLLRAYAGGVLLHGVYRHFCLCGQCGRLCDRQYYYKYGQYPDSDEFMW